MTLKQMLVSERIKYKQKHPQATEMCNIDAGASDAAADPLV